jgi:excisionase family DNA binding protein
VNTSTLERRTPLTTEEAAAYLGVGSRLVRRLVQERRIPFFHAGRFVRFLPEDLDAYIATNRVEAVR